MRAYDILHKKKIGKEISKEEIDFIVNGFTKGDIPDYQMSAFLMAVCINGMTKDEVANLTMTMANSGDTTDLSAIDGIKVDKHSTGGVGDKTTLIISPMVAACGVPVAKMSGRGLGHTGGTIDKLEAIPGFETSIKREDFIDIVNKVKVSLVGQSDDLAPADGAIYSLRDVTATVDSMPLIASSIMSKKIAAGSDKILLDVKVGQGAFMKTPETALELAETMVSIGKSVGRETVALTTNMDGPLGNAIGNTLEIIEVIDVLSGKGPKDIEKLSIELAAQMLYLADIGDIELCREKAIETIENGSALEKLIDMVEAQGGDSSYIKNPETFTKASVMKDVLAEESGYIESMDAEKLGIQSVTLGAGREKQEDQIDFAAGIYCHKKSGDQVEKGDVLATIHTNKENVVDSVAEKIKEAIIMSDNKPEVLPLVYNIIK